MVRIRFTRAFGYSRLDGDHHMSLSRIIVMKVYHGNNASVYPFRESFDQTSFIVEQDEMITFVAPLLRELIKELQTGLFNL